MDLDEFEKSIKQEAHRSLNCIHEVTKKMNHVFALAEEALSDEIEIGLKNHVEKSIDKFEKHKEALQKQEESLKKISESRAQILADLINENEQYEKELICLLEEKKRLVELKRDQAEAEKLLDVKKNLVRTYKILTGTSFKYSSPCEGIIKNKRTGKKVAFKINKHEKPGKIYEYLTKTL